MDDASRAFVVGHPIGHSRSPVIHGFWLKTLDLSGSYEALDVEPSLFGAFLTDLPAAPWVGGNVTIPHKERAFSAIDQCDDAALAIGAVNTIWREGTQLVAGNTDAHGFAANLDDMAPQWRHGTRALVIGAGGASRAVLFALRQAGYSHIDIVNRTVSRAEDLAARFGPTIKPNHLEAIPILAGDADLIVNATSLGMAGQAAVNLPFAVVQDKAVVTDIVYAPLETPFLKAAKARGLTTVDGLGMLLHQAAPGFERWFGTRPEVTMALRNHVISDLNGEAKAS